MKNRFRNLTVILSAVIFNIFFIFMAGSSVAAPVIPNESIIKGVVSEHAIISSRLIDIQPEQALYRVTINIESSESIGGKPDFIKNKIGQDVQFYTKEKLCSELFGKMIKAKTRYSGDEMGGIFWIGDIELIPEEVD